MRKYYLFKINKTNTSLKRIYSVLEELFYLNSNKFKYGITIFNELCLPFDKDKLMKRLCLKYPLNGDKFIINNFENTIIEINNILIMIETNRNFTQAFKDIYELDNNIIVCDFEKRDYFWLDDFIKLNFKLSI